MQAVNGTSAAPESAGSGFDVIISVQWNSGSQAGCGDSHQRSQDSEAEAERHRFEASLDYILKHDLVL